jgi:hypothetical protein
MLLNVRKSKSIICQYKKTNGTHYSNLKGIFFPNSIFLAINVGWSHDEVATFGWKSIS